MMIKKFVVGSLENNCFIIADEKLKECLITDPGDEPDRILDFIHENNFKVKYIVCTHAHFDHVAAVSDIKKGTDALVVIHGDDLGLYRSTKDQAALWGFDIDPQPEPDMLVSEGDKIEVGELKFEILHTPGHSPGGICLYGEGILITGDTLFSGSVGRTDLYGGNIGDLRKSFKRLISLPESIRILPGHGPESTIGKERTDNFLVYEIKDR
jgi:hydroxyacylglutathione hydrolase